MPPTMGSTAELFHINHVAMAAWELMCLWPESLYWRSWRLSAVRVFVLHAPTKIEVRRPSHSEDMAHLVCQLQSAWWPWPLTFCLWNGWTDHPDHGLPWRQIWASGAFSSQLRSRHGTDGQTYGRTDDGHQSLMPPPFGSRGHKKIRKINWFYELSVKLLVIWNLLLTVKFQTLIVLSAQLC